MRLTACAGGGRKFGTHGEQPMLDDSHSASCYIKVSRQCRCRILWKENWGKNGETLQEWTGIMGLHLTRSLLLEKYLIIRDSTYRLGSMDMVGGRTDLETRLTVK